MSEKVSRAKEFTSKANVVEREPSRPPKHNKKHDFKEKSVSSQFEDFQKLVSDLPKEGDVLSKRFMAHGLVFKLPDF